MPIFRRRVCQLQCNYKRIRWNCIIKNRVRRESSKGSSKCYCHRRCYWSQCSYGLWRMLCVIWMSISLLHCKHNLRYFLFSFWWVSLNYNSINIFLIYFITYLSLGKDRGESCNGSIIEGHRNFCGSCKIGLQCSNPAPPYGCGICIWYGYTDYHNVNSFSRTL